MAHPQNAASSTAEDVTCVVQGLSIRGKRWNAGAPNRAIALHGLLDNCGSFDRLAPLLKHLDLVAFDAAGHAKSDFRSADSQYLIWFDVSEVFGVADQLGWQTFHLLGHSRGASIATLCAGSLSERVNRLVLIDGGIPIPREPEQAPEKFAEHLRANRRFAAAKPTLYPTREKALEGRVHGMMPVSLDAAEMLAARALRYGEGSYYWRADPKIKSPSSFSLTPHQVKSFYAAISAPTLLIAAEAGIYQSSRAQEGAYFGAIPNFERQVLPGGHHLHLDGAAEDCASLINRFLTHTPPDQVP